MVEKNDLTCEEWKICHEMARVLAEGTDRNEFGKVITYMRREQDPKKFLTLLYRLPRSRFIRSKKTQTYFENIYEACRGYLHGLDQERAVLIAHWAFRLLTYYQRIDEKPR